MSGAAGKLRNLLSGRSTSVAASVTDNLVFSSLAKASYSTAVRADDWTRPPFMYAIFPTLSATPFQSFDTNSRSFFTSSLQYRLSEEEVQIETEEQFNEHLGKIQDELLPAIFYFTDVVALSYLRKDYLPLFWSYPKRVYKINIAKESLGFILSKLDIPQVDYSKMENRQYVHSKLDIHHVDWSRVEYLYFYKHLLKHSSKVVLIETTEQYNESLRKVKYEKLAAIYYFTATVSFKPSRLICPIFQWLSEKYPHVTMCKIDMDTIKQDRECLPMKLLDQAACQDHWPLMIFYKNGERLQKLAGHLIKDKLQETMEVYD